ncbi:Uncharacterised protein [uncultured archaeon]|nr:Uncharacterised protein [uncultured archaeon]
MSPLSDELNRSFQTTYQLIFGRESKHSLEGLQDYMLQYHYPTSRRASALSGKTVAIAAERYAPNARFISQDEIDFSKKGAPLSINDIKDIDSLYFTLSERFYYAGNKMFGNTQEAEYSDNCTDSFKVENSHSVVQSKNVAYSSYVRDASEHVFGSGVFIRSKFLIKVLGAADLVRSFETYFSTNNSDLFFCFFCHGCAHTMFSFNQRSKRYCIGNRELPKDQYFALRAKLVAEAADYIDQHQKFYSIFDYAPPASGAMAGLSAPQKAPLPFSLSPMDDAFKLTTKLVLGKEFGPLSKFEKFLSHHVASVQSASSPFGNEVPYSEYFWARHAPKTRLINQEEAYVLGQQVLQCDERTALSDLARRMSSIAFYCADFNEGDNVNFALTPTRYFCADVYHIADATYTKKSAYCTHATRCEAVFGCGILITNCKFCIRCHDCMDCTASMDLDSCKSCSNSMFCHNCENLENCMFCFNTKSLRYAIGNVEVGREKFMQIKQMVQAELVRQLEKEGDIKLDVCALGGRGR